MNGHACCVLAVCCPPRSAKQKSALADEMHNVIAANGEPMDHRTPEEMCRKLAGWVLDNFDLAPAGTLQPFTDAIAKLARAHKAE